MVKDDALGNIKLIHETENIPALTILCFSLASNKVIENLSTCDSS